MHVLYIMNNILSYLFQKINDLLVALMYTIASCLALDWERSRCRGYCLSIALQDLIHTFEDPELFISIYLYIYN